MTGSARRPGPGSDPEAGAVSPAQLDRLREDIGEISLRQYVRSYLDLLPGRLERMATADSAEATRVMFDLRAASAMLGARRLSELISALEHTLSVGLPPGPAQLAAVRAEADAVAGALRRVAGAESAGGPGEGAGRDATD